MSDPTIVTGGLESSKISLYDMDEAQGMVLSPTVMMAQVQSMLIENLDSQIKEIAGKIRFLKEVVGAHRKNIMEVQAFLAQPSANNHQNKPVLVLTAEQCAKLMSYLTDIGYNVNDQTTTDIPMEFNYLENQSQIASDPSSEGVITSAEVQAHFEKMANAATPEEYKALAAQIGSEKNAQMPFYFNVQKNVRVDADGNPMISVYTESLDKLLAVMETKVSQIEKDVEVLSSKLTDLTEKRKSAVDGLSQIFKLSQEAKTSIISKM